MSARSVLRFAALPAFATLAATAAVSAAPVPFGDSTYDVVLDAEASWSAAREAAALAGGTLAVISSQEEQNFVESLLLDRNATTGSYWFGVQETAVEDKFEAINGETLGFDNFAAGEPNNAGDLIEENVGGIYWTADGATDGSLLDRRGDWNDLPEVGYANAQLEDDLFRAGYLVEFADDGTDGGGGGVGGGGGGGGGVNPIPLPAAAFTFPGTALVAYFAARRMRRR